jgi:ATP-dependent DNA helicase RecG
MPEKNQKITQLSTLQFLKSPFCILKNVADYFEKCLTNLASKNRIFDLLLVAPIRAEKILFCPKIRDVLNDSLVILKLKIEEYFTPQSSRQPYKFIGNYEGEFVELVFFKIYPSQIAKMNIGKEIFVLGRLQKNMTIFQIIHPEEIVEVSLVKKLPKENLIYPLSGKLTQKFLRAKILEILHFLDSRFDERKAYENDWIDRRLLEEKKWPLFVEALKGVHNFDFEYDAKSQELSRQRLKYDELLAWQIATMLLRQQEEKSKNMPKFSSDLAEDFLKNIEFLPTNAQINAMQEIRKAILSSKTMLRLLQGDVGSGKTLVAIYAALLAVSCKKQACVIVPISILADQHFEYFKKFTNNIKIEILTGKTRKKKHEEILRDLKNGEIDILISTHAVLQDDVEFKNLGLAVIDEQHRFGVMQRLKLVEKGNEVDVLLMSATPIPRSLMMAVFGDMAISILDEKPKNRLEIETLVKSQKKSAEIYAGVKRAIERGEKIYWICPRISQKDEEDDKKDDKKDDSDLVAAEVKFKELSSIFGENNVALINGKMKEAQKEKIMAEFKGDNGAKILVATTVIEVGVDVKDATIIVIENAENFGLSQLHQLRGRVGRSDKKSYCALLYGKKYGAIAKQRLEIMRSSNDGFFIAEQDLKLRGSGEILGVRQSGELGFRLANLESDLNLFHISSSDAKKILNENAILAKKHQVLLELFGYDDCLRLISGG